MKRFMLSVCLMALAASSTLADGYWAGEGYVVPRDGVTLRVRSTMLVSRISVDVGSKVKKGDLLVQFDDRNARVDMQVAQLNLKKKELELKFALARIEAAKATVNRVQADFERVQKLQANNVISKEEVAKAEAMLASARAEFVAAEVQVELAKIDVETGKAYLLAEESKLEELALRAPFDGTIVARYTTVGDLISKPDQALLDLIGTTYLIEAPVPDRLVGTLKETTLIEIAVDGQKDDKTIKAKVALIGPVVDPRNKTVKVHFAIPYEEMKKLRPGTVVAVKIGTPKGEE